jgi:Histidinol phosphatase and related phosphatases
MVKCDGMLKLRPGRSQIFITVPIHPQGQVIQYSYVCDCRKPSPGLFLQAIAHHSLDPTRCWAIGDRLRDLEPGLQLGMKAFLVKTGYGIQEQQELSKSPFYEQITVVSSMPEIMDLIQNESKMLNVTP